VAPKQEKVYQHVYETLRAARTDGTLITNLFFKHQIISQALETTHHQVSQNH
jgi:hypothetical protein